MRRGSVIAVFALILVFVAHAADPCVAGESLKVNSVALSGVRYAVPDQPQEREYLGLPPRGEFGLGQVKASVIVVEIFSMYCPICQAEAQKINELYRMIQVDDNLRGKVKIVGIGARNTPFEVDVFRKKFSIPFPLVADDDFLVQKAVSEQLKTPTFLTLSVRKDKTVHVAGIHVGAIKDLVAFVKVLSEAATAK